MPNFQLSLNGFFMGNAASERNQDLRTEQKQAFKNNLSAQVKDLPQVFITNINKEYIKTEPNQIKKTNKQTSGYTDKEGSW